MGGGGGGETGQGAGCVPGAVFVLLSLVRPRVSGAEIAVGRTEVPFRVFVLNSSGPRVSGRSSRRWGGSTQRLYGGRRRGTERTGCWVCPKLQALIYDVLPSTTAVFSYAIRSRKLSANEQFFVGAQTVGSLLQTTQINEGVSFIDANKVCTSTNKTTIV